MQAASLNAQRYSLSCFAPFALCPTTPLPVSFAILEATNQLKDRLAETRRPFAKRWLRENRLPLDRPFRQTQGPEPVEGLGALTHSTPLRVILSLSNG